jgi:hypothetical protein
MTGISLDQAENSVISKSANIDFCVDLDDITEIPSVQSGDPFVPSETAPDNCSLDDVDGTPFNFNSTTAVGVQVTDLLLSEKFQFALTFNLPWFRFQGTFKAHSISSGSTSLTPPLASDDIVGEDRIALIKSMISSNSQTIELNMVKRLISMVETQVPERYAGEYLPFSTAFLWLEHASRLTSRRHHFMLHVQQLVGEQKRERSFGISHDAKAESAF